MTWARRRLYRLGKGLEGMRMTARYKEEPRTCGGRAVTQRTTRLCCWLAAAAALLLACSGSGFAGASGSTPRGLVVLQGTLGALPGNQPTLITPAKRFKLAGQSAYILRTLQDKRLLNQQLQLIGMVGPDGDFVVEKLFAVHNGKLYRIQYYCSVCNITYVQPGHCYCCGRETKLQEVPVSSAH
jgi:hypothetical protein